MSSLPEGLTVNGDLYLYGCTSLMSLPEGLTVNGSLSLRACTSLVYLPEVLTAQGYIDLQGCTSLRSLGNATAKKIFLSNDHKIPDEEIAMARFSDIEVEIV